MSDERMIANEIIEVVKTVFPKGTVYISEHNILRRTEQHFFQWVKENGTPPQKIAKQLIISFPVDFLYEYNNGTFAERDAARAKLVQIVETAYKTYAANAEEKPCEVTFTRALIRGQ
jgi:hypothetical protein